MAMEKLILRSVMYGADKIPDSWFEKVPGGFFKEKDRDKNGERKDGGSSDNRRNSTPNERKAGAEDFNRESDRHRSDGRSRRQDRRSRSSYDGGADDDDRHESGNDRRRSSRDRPERRRRSLDDDRYGYTDGRDSRRRQRDSRLNDRRRYVPEKYDDRDRPPTSGSGPPPNPFSPNQHIPPVDTRHPRAGPTPAATFPVNKDPSSPADRSPTQPQSATASNPPNNVYVPYAHIYGQPSARRESQSRPSTRDSAAMPTRVDSVSPPVAPPPAGYKQNPFAQEAPTAVDAGAGAQYNGQPGFINKPIDPRFSTRRYMGYDGASGSPTASPPPPRDRYTPRDSPSRDRARDGNSSGRQSRNERRSVDMQSME